MPRTPDKTRLSESNGQGPALPSPGGSRGLDNRLRVLRRITTVPLCKDPNLLDTIQRDIATMGLVGEEENGLLTYIMGTSRLLNKPLSIIYLGCSSSGKNQVQGKPLLLFPGETKIDATAITSAALFRMEGDWLSHKILVGGERRHSGDDNAADATAALRQLLSEGRISKILCTKQGNDWVSKRIEAEGPVAYSESTTSRSIFQEDLNRMIQVTTNESEEQTRAVMVGIAQIYSQDEPDCKATVDRHHEFQRALEYCDVRIPYAEILAKKMPAGKIEARRVIQQVLGTIEAVALLHQFQRERDGQGRLLATLDDYAVARHLLLKPLDRSLGFSQRARNAYDKLQAAVGGRKFSTQEAAKAIDSIYRKVTLEAIDELVGLGVLVCLEKGKGPKPAVWDWTGNALDELILPSTVALLRYWRPKTDG